MQPLQYDLQLFVAKNICIRQRAAVVGTLMQPLQCVLQHHLAYLRASTHMATAQQWWSPLHCDLQPQILKHPVTTRARTTAQCRTPCRNQSHVKATPAATASQTSCPSSPAAATCLEKHGVSRSGCPPNTSPMQNSCSHYDVARSTTSTFMQPFQRDFHLMYSCVMFLLCDVMLCDILFPYFAMWCIVVWCIVVLCIVVWCFVMWCMVVWCIVVWCIV